MLRNREFRSHHTQGCAPVYCNILTHFRIGGKFALLCHKKPGEIADLLGSKLG